MSLEEEDFNPVEFLQSLNLEDFLNCKKTHHILIENHQNNYETSLEHKIQYLYKSYNTAFRDIDLFGKDWDNEYADSFSHLVYNFIATNYDLKIFYQNPELAIDLIKFKE